MSVTVDVEWFTHPEDGPGWYVTSFDTRAEGDQLAVIGGPYATHAEAEAAIAPAKGER